MSHNRAPARFGRARAVMRIVMAAFFIGGFVLHMTAVDALVTITPDWVPFPRAVAVATGFIELAGAIGLLITARAVRYGYSARALYCRGMAREHEACLRTHRRAADPGQLVVSRAAPRASAGARLVGAVLLRRDRLAMAREGVDLECGMASSPDGAKRNPEPSSPHRGPKPPRSSRQRA